MIELAIILVSIVVDQLTKLWAAGPLAALHGGSLPVIGGVFNLTYVENRGAAFGLLQNARWLFIPLTIAAVAALSWYLVKKRRQKNWWLRIALALLIAGAVGNFIDRVLLSYVRDMLDFCLISFPVFNVADCCVSVGAVMLVIGVLIDEKRQKQAAREALSEAKGSSTAEAKADGSDDAEGGDHALPREQTAPVGAPVEAHVDTPVAAQAASPVEARVASEPLASSGTLVEKSKAEDGDA